MMFIQKSKVFFGPFHTSPKNDQKSNQQIWLLFGLSTKFHLNQRTGSKVIASQTTYLQNYRVIKS